MEKKAVSMGEKSRYQINKKFTISNTTKCRCLHSSEDALKQLFHKQKKAQLFGI